MQLSHTRPVTTATFDDPNLVVAAGLVPLVKLAQTAGLTKLAKDWLTVPTDKGANAGVKVTSLVAGMAAGADSIDDMAVLRHGGMGRVFTRTYAPSTLGQFLRAFTFGHVRQLDAVASRFLLKLAELTPLLGNSGSGPLPVPEAVPEAGPEADGRGGQQRAPFVFLDIDDTIIEVHGHQKQGAGFGYSGVRGLNALLATLATSTSAPVIVGQRLRKGACGSPRGAKRMVADALATAGALLGPDRPVLVRADSAFYGAEVVRAARTGGAHVSITVRLDPAVKRAIDGIDADAWTTITYPHPILDPATG
ncbi:MAG: IS1380 family transposase, partial [Humibacillus sp.]|nr:IS1380 family transposase [Humibacillus sp.]